MIKTTLPIIDKQIINGELKVTEREITVEVDTSIFAEERWEANFPALAERETLFAYVERVNEAGKNGKARILSDLKALYCFIDGGNEIGDFKSFCKLFDMSESDYTNRLVDKIVEVFGLVLHSSAATQKNS